CQTELQASAARGVLDFRSGLQDFLDAHENTAGFGERAARRREVVENESPLVHFGKEVRFQQAVADEGESYDGHKADSQDDWTLEDELHRSPVEIDGLAEESGQVSFFCRQEGCGIGLGLRCVAALLRGLPSHEVQAESRCPSERQEQGREQGHRHGNCESAKEGAVDACHSDKRYKYDDGRDGRTYEW